MVINVLATSNAKPLSCCHNLSSESHTSSGNNRSPVAVSEGMQRRKGDEGEMLNWASITNALYIITHSGQDGPSISRSGKINA